MFPKTIALVCCLFGIILVENSIIHPAVFADDAPTPTPVPTTTPEETPIPTVPKPSRGTELRLMLKDEDGKPVSPTLAILYLDAWSITSQDVNLTTDGNQVILFLDDDWRRSQDWAVYDFLGAEYTIHIQADGYVPLQSNSFEWLELMGGLESEARIEFPNNSATNIQAGEKRTLELIMRKPKPCYLRLVNDNGDPVTGIEVETEAFVNANNHCGVYEGVWLDNSVSDTSGLVKIPDGDFEFLFRFMGLPPHSTVVKSCLCYALVTGITKEETIIKVSQLKHQTLELVVTKDGKPFTDLELWGTGSVCDGCGGGMITKTDTNGRIYIPDFYPEEWMWIELIDQDYVRYWGIDPNKFPSTNPIVLDF